MLPRKVYAASRSNERKIYNLEILKYRPIMVWKRAKNNDNHKNLSPAVNKGKLN